MSKYGFDLDGTLTRPELAQLANDLYDAGHEVYVVTGALADTGEWTMSAREERLASLGIRYTEIVRAIDPDINQVGRRKGEACKERGISLLIDDALGYLQGVSQVSPTLCLLVLPSTF